MGELLRDAAERSIRYLDSLAERRVSPSAEAVGAPRGFRAPLPKNPTDAGTVLEQLDALGSPATMAMAGPRFFCFVICGSLPATVAAAWLSAAWDQNTRLYNSTPGTSTIEDVALGWLIDVLGLPSRLAGRFV